MLPLFWIRDEGPAVAPGPALSWFSRGAARAGVPLSERDPSQRVSLAGPAPGACTYWWGTWAGRRPVSAPA